LLFRFVLNPDVDASSSAQYPHDERFLPTYVITASGALRVRDDVDIASARRRLKPFGRPNAQ
jgi:hypothetical protein